MNQAITNEEKQKELSTSTFREEEIPIKSLTAINMKEILWETLNGLRRGKINAAAGDAIACQAREILRTIKTQQNILQHSGRNMTRGLVKFAIDGESSEE